MFLPQPYQQGWDWRWPWSYHQVRTPAAGGCSTQNYNIIHPLIGSQEVGLPKKEPGMHSVRGVNGFRLFLISFIPKMIKIPARASYKPIDIWVPPIDLDLESELDARSFSKFNFSNTAPPQRRQ